MHTARPPIPSWQSRWANGRTAEGGRPGPEALTLYVVARELAARNARFLSDTTLASRCLLRSADPDEIKPGRLSSTGDHAEQPIQVSWIARTAEYERRRNCVDRANAHAPICPILRTRGRWTDTLVAAEADEAG